MPARGMEVQKNDWLEFLFCLYKEKSHCKTDSCHSNADGLDSRNGHRTGIVFSGDDLKSAELLVQLLKDNGDKGFIDDNLTAVLCSCAVAWVKQNPEMIPPLEADYIR